MVIQLQHLSEVLIIIQNLSLDLLTKNTSSFICQKQHCPTFFTFLDTVLLQSCMQFPYSTAKNSLFLNAYSIYALNYMLRGALELSTAAEDCWFTFYSKTFYFYMYAQIDVKWEVYYWNQQISWKWKDTGELLQVFQITSMALV